MKVEVDFATIPAGQRRGEDLLRWISELPRGLSGDRKQLVVMNKADWVALWDHVMELSALQYVAPTRDENSYRVWGLECVIGHGGELPYLVERVE